MTCRCQVFLDFVSFLYVVFSFEHRTQWLSKELDRQHLIRIEFALIRFFGRLKLTNRSGETTPCLILGGAVLSALAQHGVAQGGLIREILARPGWFLDGLFGALIFDTRRTISMYAVVIAKRSNSQIPPIAGSYSKATRPWYVSMTRCHRNIAVIRASALPFIRATQIEYASWDNFNHHRTPWRSEKRPSASFYCRITSYYLPDYDVMMYTIAP